MAGHWDWEQQQKQQQHTYVLQFCGALLAAAAAFAAAAFVVAAASVAAAVDFTISGCWKRERKKDCDWEAGGNIELRKTGPLVLLLLSPLVGHMIIIANMQLYKSQ